MHANCYAHVNLEQLKNSSPCHSVSITSRSQTLAIVSVTLYDKLQSSANARYEILSMVSWSVCLYIVISGLQGSSYLYNVNDGQAHGVS